MGSSYWRQAARWASEENASGLGDPMIFLFIYVLIGAIHFGVILGGVKELRAVGWVMAFLLWMWWPASTFIALVEGYALQIKNLKGQQ